MNRHLALSVLFATYAFSARAADEELLDRIPGLLAAARRPADILRQDHDILRYELDVRVDPREQAVAGSVKIMVQRQADTDLVMHCSGLTIDEITLEEQPLEWTSRADVITVVLPDTADSKVLLEVEYHGKPSRGLYFPPVTEYGVQAWTQGQSELNRGWFPCFDQPAERATFHLEVTVPTEFRTLSNGTLLAQRAADTGWRTDTWELNEEIPTYLITLAVGDFVELDLGNFREIPLRAYVPPPLAKAGSQLLQATGRVLESLESLTGSPYPYSQLRTVVVDDYPYGGMENATCITLGVDSLVGTEDFSELQAETTQLLVHEIAHHWWGNTITCQDWRDLWLNEGFATYAEFMVAESSAGPPVLDAAKILWETQESVMLATGERSMVPEQYRYADALFDEHVYERGAAFLHLIRGTIGDEVFFRTLQQWTQHAAQQSVSTPVFREFWQAATEPDLTHLWREWLYQPGLPYLDCRWQFDAATQHIEITVDQEQLLDAGPSFYHLPFELAYPEGGELKVVSLPLSAPTTTRRIAVEEKPSFVFFNHRFLVPGMIEITQTPKQWMQQLIECGDPLARAQAADQLGWLAVAQNDGDIPAWNEHREKQVVAALALCLVQERMPWIRALAAQALGELPSYEAMQALRLGLSDASAEVRTSAAMSLGQFENDLGARNALLEFGPSEPIPSVEAAILAAVSGLSTTDDAEFLLAFANNRELHPNLRAVTLVAAGYENSETARDTAVELSKPGSPVLVREAAIDVLGLILLDDSSVAPILLERLKDRSLRIQYATIGALRGLKDPQYLEAIVDYYERAPVDDLKADALRLIRKLWNKVK